MCSSNPYGSGDGEEHEEDDKVDDGDEDKDDVDKQNSRIVEK